jgi:hypothetical protein
MCEAKIRKVLEELVGDSVKVKNWLTIGYQGLTFSNPVFYGFFPLI